MHANYSILSDVSNTKFDIPSPKHMRAKETLSLHLFYAKNVSFEKVIPRFVFSKKLKENQQFFHIEL